MKVIFSGGGTGGHVYPALAVATALAQELGDSEPLDALYVGTTSGIEKELVARAGLPFRAVAAGAIRGRSPWGLAASLVKLTRGVAQARRAIAQFQPNAILTTGGYASVPVALAARTPPRPPLVVYLPDVRPGWALRLMARLSRRVAVSRDARRAQIAPSANFLVALMPSLRSLGRFTTSLRDQLLSLVATKSGKHAVLLSGLSPTVWRRQLLHAFHPATWQPFCERRQKPLPS